MTGIYAEREYIRDGKITKMVIVELTDASGKCECALFGDYVDELNKKMGKDFKGKDSFGLKMLMPSLRTSLRRPPSRCPMMRAGERHGVN
ncbi:hypothetical protein P8452_28607 [Trifolium repens]|nr:hypothetical protein P8452_28607 [Trifolium repens]